MGNYTLLNLTIIDMKKIYNLLLVLAIPAVFLLTTGEILFHDGSPGGKTGSPGDNGANCTDCHSGTPMNQEMWIWSPELLAQGYSPGETYNFLVHGTDNDASKFGFEATAEDEDGNKVGSFTAGVIGMTQTINDGHSITHTAMGNTPIADSGTVWMFTWTAPAESVGPIGFYAAINAANGNGANSGDQIYLTSLMVSPNTGILENKYNNDLELYPNPSNGIVTIGKNGLKGDRIEVMNLLGHVVYSSEFSHNNNRFDLGFLDNGIYIVRIGDNSQRLILR